MMKIALITFPGEPSPEVAAFFAASQWQAPVIERWALRARPEHAEQALGQLEAQWRHTPVDLLVFPADAPGDELATRLALRLNMMGVCQAICWDEETHSITKASWGNTLTATLALPPGPVCLSVARQQGSGKEQVIPPFAVVRDISLVALPLEMRLVSHANPRCVAPLLQAQRVVVFGQGGAESDKEQQFARRLDAEIGYTRQRVMLGGCDDSRMIGISGEILAPELCIVAGASGAAAFSAGIRQSQFIVAINSNPDAPIFSQADVGIVADWQPALDALTQLYAETVR